MTIKKIFIALGLLFNLNIMALKDLHCVIMLKDDLKLVETVAKDKNGREIFLVQVPVDLAVIEKFEPDKENPDLNVNVPIFSKSIKVNVNLIEFISDDKALHDYLVNKIFPYDPKKLKREGDIIEIPSDDYNCKCRIVTKNNKLSVRQIIIYAYGKYSAHKALDSLKKRSKL